MHLKTAFQTKHDNLTARQGHREDVPLNLAVSSDVGDAGCATILIRHHLAGEVLPGGKLPELQFGVGILEDAHELCMELVPVVVGPGFCLSYELVGQLVAVSLAETLGAIGIKLP